MPVITNTNVISPMPTNSGWIDRDAHSRWTRELTAAITPRETGWQNIDEALNKNGLFMLDTLEGRINFCKAPKIDEDSRTALQRFEEMMQASAEGRLFVRNRETGMLMQINTTKLDQNECDLQLSVQVRGISHYNNLYERLNPVAKPDRLSIFTYIASWFSDKYKQIVDNYKAERARYEDYQAGIVRLPKDKIDLYGNEPEENAANAEAQQVQQEEQEVQEEASKQQEYPSRELNPYNKENVKAGVTRMTYGENLLKKIVPENSPVQLNGRELGALVAMAMADPALSFTSKKSNTKYTNEPDTYYKEIVGGKFLQGNPITKKGQGFQLAAERSVGIALRDAAGGDFTKLAAIIANGLKQNNKMLQSQKELSDVYTGYANLGKRVMNIMESNEQLKKAVMAQLGDDTNQIDIANAAKNISDLRVTAMKTYQKMLKDFHIFADYRSEDKDGKEIIKHRPAVDYGVQDVVAIGLLSYIDVEMNFGNYDLTTSEFSNPNAANAIIEDCYKSEILHDFMWDVNRGKILRDPIKMKLLFETIVQEEKDGPEVRGAEREQGAFNADLYNYNADVNENEVIDNAEVQKIFG